MPYPTLAAVRLGLAVYAISPVAASTQAGLHHVIIDGGRIRVAAPGGGFLPDSALLGAKLKGRDEAGRPLAYRIDSIIPYRDSLVAMTLYSFSSPDPAGGWTNSCGPDKAGRRRGFAVPGYFDAAGGHVRDSSFTIACTGGAAGKCALFGYGPWVRAADGTPMLPTFEACMRMVRADYCGDGTPHTRNGTGIEMWDPKGVHDDETRLPGYVFEASWAPDGAVWLKRTRLPDVADLDSIARECPDRYIKMRSASDTVSFGPAYLCNRSLPK